MCQIPVWFSAYDVHLDIVAVDYLEIFTLQDLMVAVAIQGAGF